MKQVTKSRNSMFSAKNSTSRTFTFVESKNFMETLKPATKITNLTQCTRVTKKTVTAIDIDKLAKKNITLMKKKTLASKNTPVNKRIGCSKKVITTKHQANAYLTTAKS